jgi:hypothetical protein
MSEENIIMSHENLRQRIVKAINLRVYNHSHIVDLIESVSGKAKKARSGVNTLLNIWKNRELPLKNVPTDLMKSLANFIHYRGGSFWQQAAMLTDQKMENEQKIEIQDDEFNSGRKMILE